MTKALKRKAAKPVSPTSPAIAGVNTHNTLVIARAKDQSFEAALAQTASRPTVQGACTTKAILAADFKDLHLGELINALSAQVKLASEGDLSRPEATLVTQAHTLDILFNRLTRVAVANIGHGHLEAVATYMKLALRAQSQCRAVAETLHEMKNPRPVAFFQQANIAQTQQVNNGQVSRAGELGKAPNELLEQTHGERLDSRTASPTIGANSQLEAVGALNRAKDKGR